MIKKDPTTLWQNDAWWGKSWRT